MQESVQPYDSSWLLSALAQSGAALVAIAGGLLATRYVGLHTELESAKRAAHEAKTRHEKAMAHCAKRQDRLNTHRARVLLHSQKVLERLWEKPYEGTPRELLASVGQVAPDTVAPFLLMEYKELAQELKQAKKEFSSIREGSLSEILSWPTYATKNSLSPKHPHLWEWALARSRCDRAELETQKDPNTANSIVMGQRRDIARRRYATAGTRYAERSQEEFRKIADQLEDELAHATRSLESTEYEFDVAEGSVKRLGTPEGFGLALQVFALTTVLSVLVPASGLVFGLSNLSVWGRVLFGIVFAAGLGLLLIYLVVYSQVLDQRHPRSRLPKNVFDLFFRSSTRKIEKGSRKTNRRKK